MTTADKLLASVLPLENGDRLTRDTFKRFYVAIFNNAELTDYTEDVHQASDEE